MPEGGSIWPGVIPWLLPMIQAKSGYYCMYKLHIYSVFMFYIVCRLEIRKQSVLLVVYTKHKMSSLKRVVGSLQALKVCSARKQISIGLH